MTTEPWPSAYRVPSLIASAWPSRKRVRPIGGRAARLGESVAPPGPASWARTSCAPPWPWTWPGTVRCWSTCAASAVPAAAVVLVMSVIAAMWSQSIPWRIPSSSPVMRTPIPATGGVAATAAAMSGSIGFVGPSRGLAQSVRGCRE